MILEPFDKKEAYERILGFLNAKKDKTAIRSEILNELAAFPYIDWIGFYDLAENGATLVLGEYIGSLACERIPLAKGVCGKCAREGTSQLVPDVTALAYHIACSSSTQSEAVVPILRDDKVIAVLDLDSDALSAFTEEDIMYLERIASYL